MTTILWFVIVLLCFSILMKVRNIMQIQSCPKDEILKDYFEGRLKKNDKDEYERVISHLGICSNCQERLTTLATSENEAQGRSIEDHLI